LEGFDYATPLTEGLEAFILSAAHSPGNRLQEVPEEASDSDEESPSMKTKLVSVEVTNS